MLTYLVKRIVGMAVTLVVISIVVFVVIHVAPGNPSAVDPSTEGSMFPVDPKIVELRKEWLGIDDPLHVQYFRWMKNMLTLDLGTSLTLPGAKVKDMIASRIGLTVKLNIAANMVVYCLAIPLGLLSAKNRYASAMRRAVFDSGTGIMLIIFYSIPGIVLGTMLILLFSKGGLVADWIETGHPALSWLVMPIGGVHSPQSDGFSTWAYLGDTIRHFILPVIALSLGGLAFLSKLTRTSLLENLRQDFVMTARAKGLRERAVVYSHALRNSLLPMITILAGIIPAMIGGSVIIETIFDLPGMGRLYFEAVKGRDYALILCLSMITATLTLLAILVADILYAVVDPRIRYD